MNSVTAVKYLACMAVFVVVARSFGATGDAAVLGYCVLTAGFIAGRD